jgi:hypothetical protein
MMTENGHRLLNWSLIIRVHLLVVGGVADDTLTNMSQVNLGHSERENVNTLSRADVISRVSYFPM